MSRTELILFGLILSVLCSCSSNNAINDVNQDTLYNSIVSVEDSQSGTETDKFCVSCTFLELVERIDSLGYRYDTLRYGKIYANEPDYPEKLDYQYYNNYVFYLLPFNESIPYLFNEMKLWGTFRFKGDTSQDWKLNIEKFKCVRNITGYFFSAKTPTKINTIKYSIDGIIEEWKFNDKYEALKMSEELGCQESFVYFNRGAYICSIENYVYIFYSRSVSFYGKLQVFFNWFVKKNKAKIPNNGILRKTY